MPSLQRAIFERGASREALAEILNQEAEGIYSFEIFTQEFCKTFLAELDHYSSVADEKNIQVSTNSCAYDTFFFWGG